MKFNIPSHQAYTKTPVYAINNPLFVLAFLLVLLPTWVSAQITGRVVDTAGNTLEGVHISALHNGAQTTSGADGSFSLELLEDPVGIRGQDFLERRLLPAQGSQLQMNLQSGQLEVYTQSGVYDLQGKFLRVGENAGVYRYGKKGALRKALAQADTLVFVKAGYVTARVEIVDDAVDLGDVVMEDAPEGYLCANIVLDANQMCDPRDGKVYRIATIGDQDWMAENLNFESTSGSYCYDDDSANCDTYGRLYTWAVAMGAAASSTATPSGVQGVCPVGWHLPSADEWEALSDYVIANSAGISISNIGDYLKSSTGWNSSGNGKDDFGFSGLPGGFHTRFNYHGVGEDGLWWSSTEESSSVAYSLILSYDGDYSPRVNFDKSFAISVRCLANASPTVRIVSVSPDKPVVGETVSFTADTTGIYNESSVPVVTWSVNGGSFGSAGIDFAYAPIEAGPDTIIAKVEQRGMESFDTVYIKVYAVLTDNRDNQEYLYITIGTQTWMAENLNYDLGTGSYCYNDSISYCDTYGRLYTWDAAMAGASSSNLPSGVQGVCPDGWHLPSDGEWTILSNYVIANTAGTSTSNIGYYLKANFGWNSRNGTDDFGFSGLPGGFRDGSGRDINVSYLNVGNRSYWWSSRESSDTYANTRSLHYDSGGFDRSQENKFNENSVRCLQGDGDVLTYTLTFASDGGSSVHPLELAEGASITSPTNPTKVGHAFIGWEPALPAIMPSADFTVTAQWQVMAVAGTFTDTRDSQEYRTTTIGDQTWMAENLNFESTSGSYCYRDDPANCDTYGRLYTWDVAMGGSVSSSTTPSGVQGVCPVGWHLPSDAEWTSLAEYVASITGLTQKNDNTWMQIGPKLKATTGWSWPPGITSDDAFGFSGLGGGYKNPFHGYGDMGSKGVWLSSTEINNSYAYYPALFYGHNSFNLSHNYKSSAGSVRCVMDEE
jgi:uncharacterized protein (TIGR02145 family)